MSSYHELKHRVARIQEQGGVIDEIEIAEDIQHDIITQMLSEGESSDTLPDALKDALQTSNGASAPLLGLTSFHGFPVTRRPSGSGIRIRYH